jgi:hypothetical protein
MDTSLRYFALLLGLFMWLPSTLYAQTKPPAPPVNTQASLNHPGWSVDSRMGCWVWNAHPAANETVTWSGTCNADGRASGQGALEWHSDGSVYKYEGAMQDGKRQGKGVYMYPNGNRYEGEWRDGVAHGAGEYWTRDRHFVGTWTDGCFRDGNFRTSVGRPLSECR